MEILLRVAACDSKMGLQITDAVRCKLLSLVEGPHLMCATNAQIAAASILRNAGYLEKGAGEDFYLMTPAGGKLLQEWSDK